MSIRGVLNGHPSISLWILLVEVIVMTHAYSYRIAVSAGQGQLQASTKFVETYQACNQNLNQRCFLFFSFFFLIYSI